MPNKSHTLSLLSVHSFTGSLAIHRKTKADHLWCPFMSVRDASSTCYSHYPAAKYILQQRRTENS
eukprot:52097-Eustigmatos_ZCMA.PRE.1